MICLCVICCSRYIVHCLVRLEKTSADELLENSSRDADAECVAAKKTKLLGVTCSHVNECRLLALCHEIDYCNQLLDDAHTGAMQWQMTLIQRHLAWTHRLCQSKSSPVVSFHNSLSV